MTTLMQWLKTAVLLCIIVAAVSCSHSDETGKLVLPDFVQSYGRDPFGSRQFHAFKRASDPLWDQLQAEYANIELHYCGVPETISAEQVQQKLAEQLGDAWTYDQSLSERNSWGWSVVYHQSKNIVAFVTVDTTRVDVPATFPMIPAGIITNLSLETP